MKIKLRKDETFSRDENVYLIIDKSGIRIRKEIERRYDYNLEQRFNPITKELTEVMTFKRKNFTEERALF